MRCTGENCSLGGGGGGYSRLDCFLISLRGKEDPVERRGGGRGGLVGKETLGRGVRRQLTECD